MQAGRAIPVKVTLGGDRGPDVHGRGAQLDEGRVLVRHPEQPGQTSTAGQSGLSFGGSQYVYVWKTEKSWAGTCRQLVVKLRDNTVHTARFSLQEVRAW